MNEINWALLICCTHASFSVQEHVSLFVCHTRGRVPVPPFVHGHGAGCKDELLIPETERLMKQLEYAESSF